MMIRLHIDRIALKLHGISTDIAQAALDGLDNEMVRRLQIRGVNSSVLSGLSSSLRLPSIHSATPLDAETLRMHIADGLMTLLSPEVISNHDIQTTSDAGENT
jgi:hypothetical protein